MARFEPAPCAFTVPFGQGASISCGTLIVPEDRAHPERSEVRLAVAVLAATGDAPASDPVVFLNGGPGGSTTALLIQAFIASFAAPLQRRRDIVLLDLRGTGRSEPTLDCPEVDRASSDWAETETILSAVEACRDRLLSDGVDLGAYGSAASAADVHDLMHALGYDEWNLLGLSYGSRVALTALRDHPEDIRSAALDSPVPLQANLALDAPAGSLEYVLGAVFADCEADASCRERFPDLDAKLYAAVAELDRAPVLVDLPDLSQYPASPLRSRNVNGGRVLQIIQSALFDYDQIRKLPSVITHVASGDVAALRQIPGQPIGPLTLQQGAFYAVWCVEEAPFYTSELIAEAIAGLRPELRAYAQGAIEFNLEACRRFGMGTPPASENESVSSDVPTLLLEGEYDGGNRPPSYAEQTAASLSHSTRIVFPAFPHALLFAPSSEIAALRSTCAMQLVAEFLDDPSRGPSGPCLDDLPPAVFPDTE